MASQNIYLEKYMKYKKKYMSLMTGGGEYKQYNDYSYDNDKYFLKIDHENNNITINTYDCENNTTSENATTKFSCNTKNYECIQYNGEEVPGIMCRNSNIEGFPFDNIFDFSGRKLENTTSLCYANSLFQCLAANIIFTVRLLFSKNKNCEKKSDDEKFNFVKQIVDNIVLKNNDNSHISNLIKLIKPPKEQNDITDLFNLIQFECNKYYSDSFNLFNHDQITKKAEADTNTIQEKIIMIKGVKDINIDEILLSPTKETKYMSIVDGETKIDDSPGEGTTEINFETEHKLYNFIVTHIIPYNFDHGKFEYTIHDISESFNDIYSKNECYYYLYAVACHNGAFDKKGGYGHYYSYVKQPELYIGETHKQNSQWYTIDDDTNDTVNFNDIKGTISKQAILLFYIRGQEHTVTYNNTIYKYKY